MAKKSVTKISPKEYKKYLDFAFKAHQENSTADKFRQKGTIPYINHPLWCATTLLSDTLVPTKDRIVGFKVLVLHDVLEDTSLPLPSWVEPEVSAFVQKMTYKNSDEALEEIKTNVTTWPRLLKLLKLTDGLYSMMEFGVGEVRRHKWKKALILGIKEVEKDYGNIRIVQIAKAISKNTDW